MPDPVIRWDEAELAAMARQDYIRRAMATYGGQVASIAAADAPKRTGAGATSIKGRTVLEDNQWTARVSWNTTHYYMRMQDLGTRYLPARHFLERALDRFAR